MDRLSKDLMAKTLKAATTRQDPEPEPKRNTAAADYFRHLEPPSGLVDKPASAERVAEKLKDPPRSRRSLPGKPAKVNRRTDPILPAKLAMVDPIDRRAGTLFSVAAHTLDSPTGQRILPGFGNEYDPQHGPALPLRLYDLGAGAAGLQGGRGAPLALRLFIEAVLSVPLADRDQPVNMDITLRELLAWMYPNGAPAPNKYWPLLNEAVEAIEHPSARIDWWDPVRKRGGRRRVVSVTDIPRGPGALDDLITLTVNLPPGSEQGPIIDRQRLRQWGLRSAPIYRAQIGLAYHWYWPGVTRMPIRDGKHWWQIQDPERYPLATPAMLRSLLFPTSTQRQRRNLEGKAREHLKRMIEAGDVRLIQGRLLPPKNSDVCPDDE